MVTLLSIHLKRLYPDWSTIQKYVEYSPNEVFFIDEYKKTPLHYLFRRPNLAPTFVVHSFITIYPEAAMKQDLLHQTPFLLACWSNAPLQVLHLLLDVNVEAAWIPDNQMRYPIDVLARSCCQQNLRKIELILNAFPKCKRFKFCSNLHPSIIEASSFLHKACASPTPLQIIEFMIKTYPDMTSAQDELGNIPLFYAAANSAIEREVLALLIENNPKSLEMTNKKGDLALHVAIENGVRHWKYLFKSYPNAIKLEHEQSGLLPFMIAASTVRCNCDNDLCKSRLASFNTLYELILLSPDSIKV